VKRAAAALLAVVAALTCSSSTTTAPSPSPRPHTVADITYATVNGKALALDLDLPAAGGPFPVIVWIRGGAWAEGDKAGGPAARYAQFGYAVARVNYRLSGEAVFPRSSSTSRARCAGCARTRPSRSTRSSRER